ncbi:MAG: hypothetical protein IJ011_04595 [Clostridia bacterium]|nr:hypothetical protein [Clostridia bacterium]
MDEKFEDIEIEETINTKENIDLGEDNSPEDDFLYEGAADTKKSEAYGIAVKSVVLGSVAIVLSMFALLLYMVGGGWIAVAVGITALVLAVVGLKSLKKCGSALVGTLEEGMVKAGRTVSKIGVIIASIVLAYIVICIVIYMIMLAIVVLFYIMTYAMVILAAI